MNTSDASEAFYAGLPVFHDFTRIVDGALYQPLPEDWMVGAADIDQSTKAIQDNRYKAVNMAGAAVIVAVTNALGGRDFPFVFGGDGASFAVPASAADLARAALAATATWVKDELDLRLRISLIPVSEIRAQGYDVRVARYAPSPNVSIASFSGGGMAWADAAMKQGRFAVEPSPPELRPDLNGLSCRYDLILASRGLILSFVMVPAPGASPEAFRAAVEDIARIVERSPDASRPVPGMGLRLRWPPQGRLVAVAAAGTARFGLHRQDAAMMTCFAPSPANPNHIHFIDGALGGYAMAASALKAQASSEL